MNDLINFADIDGDGVIDYLEFVSLMMNLNFEERNERIARGDGEEPGSPGNQTETRANGTTTESPTYYKKKKEKPAPLQRR